MKFSAILLFVAVICYAEAQKCSIEGLTEVAKKCLVATKASEIDFLDLITLKSARSDNAKCLRACIMKDCDYLDSSGKIPAVFAKDTATLLGAGDLEKSKKIEATITTCLESTKHKDDLCEYSEDVFQCIVTACKNCGITVPNFNG